MSHASAKQPPSTGQPSLAPPARDRLSTLTASRSLRGREVLPQKRQHPLRKPPVLRPRPIEGIPSILLGLMRYTQVLQLPAELPV